MPGLKHMPQTNEPSAAPPAPPAEGDKGGHTRAHARRAPDRRHQRRWVPITMGWLSLLIGLTDIIGVAIPGLHLHLYGKSPRPGRKLGHLTLRSADADTLHERLERVRGLVEM